MGLKVWLPLDGDLRNLGSSNVEVTNNGATVDDAGKIGKCYSFDGNDDYIRLNSSELYNIFTGGTQQFSICFWVYHADTTRAIIFGDYNLSGAINFNTELTTDHKARFYWAGAPDKTFASTFSVNTWTHLTLAYNGNKLLCYINGVKITDEWSGTLATKNKTSGVFYLGRDNRTGTTTLNGKLNDFRIYDHCLSAAEVKEIAQGLVVHYKLNGNLFGNPNLYTGSKNFSGSWVNGSAWTTSTETYQNFTVKQKSTTWGGLAQNISCTNGDIFTISFYGKVENGGNILSIHRSSLGNVTTGLTILGGNFSGGTTWVNTSENGSQWKRYWATLQITSADITYLQWRLENSINGKNFYICGIKLEKGAAVTPWCLADSEMNIDRTIVKDSSGYGYNGIVVGSLSSSNDSPRYDSGSYFNGSSYVYSSPGSMAWYQMDKGTLACWMKPTDDMTGWRGSWGVCDDLTYTTKGWAITDYANKFYFTYTNGSYYQLIGSGKTLTQNEWHHCAATIDGSTVKLYFDGELVKSDTFSWGTTTLPANTRMELGVDFPGSNETFTGCYSDARFYVTALSAEDIKALYNTSIKVDNLGEVHTFELEESGGRELMQGTVITSSYGNFQPFTNYNNGELYFNANSTSAGSVYVPISPTGKTYYWDVDISVNTGNRFYIGFERYDADKTSRSNSACVYVVSIKPSSDVVHQRYYGTVDLSTDGVNPCAFIRLRILNGWTGTASGVTGIAAVHRLSLREVTTIQNPKIHKDGIFLVDELNEHRKASFYKNGIVEATEFIER